ncbi:MAG: S8 family serine peptidase, partial [Candidatus Cloacimonetes bacterium]|nr:S8 family serine peptidase [Candidatus Cloacimonadota bacterium]
MRVALVCIILTFVFLITAETNLTHELITQLEISDSNDWIEINIRLRAQYSQKELLAFANEFPQAERRRVVIEELQQFSAVTQASVLSQLNAEDGYVSIIRPLWIANIINCHAKPNAIRRLDGHPDIERIDWDNYSDVIPENGTEGSNTPTFPTRDIAGNVTQVNADQVWLAGYTGQNIVVAVIDSGVNYNHEDLASHMWTDAAYPYHGYDFCNIDNDPIDDHGHGTHCAGTVAGDGTGGTQTGIAPDAEIMAIKTISDIGDGQESDTWSAIQFAANNGADLFTMSLGWTITHNPDKETWRNTLDNYHAMGLVACIAAGNERSYISSYPVPENVRTPGNVPPPWLHPDQILQGGVSAVICVGAVDELNILASFSSMGPCDWSAVNNFNDYPWNPEMGLFRPDVCAPGVDIVSCDNNITGYDTKSGTSMATPCTAGVVALMLSKNQWLIPAQIDQILETSALPLGIGKDNDFGSGRVDALAAITQTPYANVPPFEPSQPNPEDNAQFVVTHTNFSWFPWDAADLYDFYLGTDNPPTNVVNGDTTSVAQFSLDTPLASNTQYYWQIQSHNAHGDTLGAVWSFSTAPQANEDFETGNFNSYGWGFSGYGAWTIQTDDPISGQYCIQAGNIANNQHSSIAVTVETLVQGDIVFYKKVSCFDSPNDDGDYLVFFIDGTEMGRWDGNISWSYEAFNVLPGTHEFKWRYQKNAGGTGLNDTAWIDYIIFPPMSAPPQNLMANVFNDTDVHLQWDLPSVTTGLTEYYVYRNNNMIALITDPTATSYNNTGLPDGAYTYYLTSRYNTEESLPSNSVDVVINLNAPHIVSSSVVNVNNVFLQWIPPTVWQHQRSASDNNRVLDGYTVYRDAQEICTIENPTVTQYTDDTALPNAEYEYYLTASYNGIVSLPSNSSFIEIEATYPPNQFSAQLIENTTIEIGWRIPDMPESPTLNGLTGYNIYRNDELIATPEVADTIWSDTPDATGQFCYYMEAVFETLISLPTEEIIVDILSAESGIPGFITKFRGNYPNPFNPETILFFSLSKELPVSLVIYDIRGRLVAELLHNERLSAGQHKVVWNAVGVSSGIYFCRMKTA